MPIVERHSVAVELDFVLSGLIGVPAVTYRLSKVGPRELLMPLLANGSGDVNHRGVGLRSASPGEKASFRLPDGTVCLCRGCREYDLRDSTSHTHELNGADAPRSMGLHGPAIHADNFPPSVRSAILPRRANARARGFHARGL